MYSRGRDVLEEGQPCGHYTLDQRRNLVQKNVTTLNFNYISTLFQRQMPAGNRPYTEHVRSTFTRLRSSLTSMRHVVLRSRSVQTQVERIYILIDCMFDAGKTKPPEQNKIEHIDHKAYPTFCECSHGT